MTYMERMGRVGGRATALLGVVWVLGGAAGAWAEADGPPPGRAYLDVGHRLVERGEVRQGLPLVAVTVAAAPDRFGAETYLLAVLDRPRWRDDAALHEAVLAVVPGNRPVLERAIALYERRGRYAEAGGLHLREAGIAPGTPEARQRLASYFDFVGRKAETVDDGGSLADQADAGDPTALFMVGRTYLVEAANGGPAGRLERGLAALRQAARLGYTPARRFLGALYLDGTQVPRDLARGVAQYELAAAKGDALARRMLADMYYSGGLLPRNPSRAVYWYQAVLADPDPGYRRGDDWEIRLRLADLYLAGDGVTRDPARARALVAEAALDTDAPQALRALANFYARGEGGVPAPSLALSAYYDAATEYLDRGFLHGVQPDESRREAQAILVSMERIDPHGGFTRRLRERLETGP